MEDLTGSIVVLADDLTGTLDTAVQFVQQGIDTVSFPTEASFRENAEWGRKVYVVNTNSRHLPNQEAYRILFDLSLYIRARGCGFLIKKTDSALRGSIGAELDAVMTAYNAQWLVFAPSYPDMERYTVNGIHYCGNTPIAKSVFGRDPFNPVLHSHVAQILQETSSIRTVTLGIGRPPYVPAQPSIFVMDAQNNAHLNQICQSAMALGTPVLLAGCAGLAKALAKTIATGPKLAQTLPDIEAVLVLSGSLNQITMQQINYLASAGYFVRLLHSDAELKAGFQETEACMRLVNEVCQTLETRHMAILATAGFEGADSGNLEDLEKDEVSQALAGIARRIFLRKRGCALVILGGDTLLSVVTNTFTGNLLPISEIMPGVPLSLAHFRDGGECLIATRSGGFGTDDSLETILRYFKDVGVSI